MPSYSVERQGEPEGKRRTMYPKEAREDNKEESRQCIRREGGVVVVGVMMMIVM